MKKLTTEEFIKRALGVHGDRYDYTDTIYTNKRTKIKITCKKHGVFEQLPLHHLNGHNCPVCSNKKKDTATFVTQAKANGSMWGIQDYRIHATIARMFCAYYKTTNISTFNSSIPCSGGTKPYNAGKTGGTISLGNKDGRLATLEDSAHYSTSFLGLEDCYYSKWEFVQGINILKGKYVVYDGGSFPDKDVAELEAAGATNIRVVGYEPNPAATEHIFCSAIPTFRYLSGKTSLNFSITLYPRSAVTKNALLSLEAKFISSSIT